MKRTLLTLALLVSLAAFASIAGCATGGAAVDDPGSRAGMPPTLATLSSEFERMCDEPGPCGAEGPRDADERAACLASAREASTAPCAAEVFAITRCGEPLVVCTADGEVDEEASWRAMEGPCGPHLAAVGACCETYPTSIVCAGPDLDGGGDDATDATGDPDPGADGETDL